MAIEILTRHTEKTLKLAVCPLVAVLCAGCLAEKYQAPVTDRSEVLDQSGPLIVVNSDDTPSRYGNPVASPPPGEPSVTEVRAGRLASPTTSGFAVHRVARGESLYSIAFQHDLDFRSLAIANNLTPPYTIYEGQELSLDINRPAPLVPDDRSSVGATGRVVENNGVARAQAASSSVRGVIRQPISRVRVAEPEWEWPLQGTVLTGFQADTGRKGIDIRAVAGQPVHAAAAGEVVYAGNGIQGAGNLIIIRHNERLLSAYAHNQTLLVTEGQTVRAGEQIGEAGVNAGGDPVLHFEIRRDGKPVDPQAYLPGS